MKSNSQRVKKVIAWRIISVIVSACMTMFFFGIKSLNILGAFALSLGVALMIAHFLFETAWDRSRREHDE
jgi:uncharacterized membrane protein